MGSPISSIIAGISLQFFEEIFIKRWIENGEISYYKGYVDDILIISDHNKTNEHLIFNNMNNIHKHLEFKITEEENKINELDLTIHRHSNKLNTEIYRKSTQTDATIHFASNHHLNETRSFNFLYKQDDNTTNHRTSRTTRMEHHTYNSQEQRFSITYYP